MLLRDHMGAALRRRRVAQSQTLRQVSAKARVSLGYLSEVERGQKEASSELLASICQALEIELADLLAEVALTLVVPSNVSLLPVAATSTSGAA